MDPPSTVKSFKYMSSTQQPMYSVVEAPLHYRSSPSPSPHNNSSFQEASFSTYLNYKDPLQKPQEDDTEISIFDAHKYFNENTDPMKKSETMRLSSSTEGYGRNFRTRSFHATPSEASWNSQTGLLPGGVGIPLRNVEDSRKLQSSRKWAFGRRCCCTGKKSVDVKEATTTSDSEQNVNNNFLYAKRDSYKSKHSDSPTSSITNSSVQIHHQKVVVPLPDPPRQQRISASGGFSFPVLNNSNQTTKPPLKPIITTKPVIMCDPPLEVFQAANTGQQCPDEDDMGSDASSDLFEIESFSTQTWSYPRRDSLDEAPTLNVRRFALANNDGRRSLDEPPTPSVAATECYAPSEVSIDWSVTTDRASVSNLSASEIGSAALMRRRMEESSTKNGGGGLLLMSCRQEKAVSVGPQPQPVKGMQVVGGRPGPPRGANKPPLGTDHSAPLSLAFAA